MSSAKKTLSSSKTGKGNDKDKDKAIKSDSSSSIPTVNTFELPLPKVKNDRDKPKNSNVLEFDTNGSLSDSCACLVYCENDKSTLICDISDKGLWLPLTAINMDESWGSAANRLLELIKTSIQAQDVFTFSVPTIIHVMRIQVPQTCKFLTRVTFKILATPIDKENSTKLKGSKIFKWNNIGQIAHDMKELYWGPEPFQFMQLADKKVKQDNRVDYISEFDSNDAKKYLPRDLSRNVIEKVLKSAMFKEKDIDKIYTQFLSHCYPSQFMTKKSFQSLLNKIEWNISEERVLRTFSAFNINHNYLFIDFYDLLCGLAAMDQAVTHGGQTGEFRVGYIFRYYDSDDDGYLTFEDMCRMQKDIAKLRNRNETAASIEVIVKNAFNEIGGPGAEKIDHASFLNAVARLKFRGTSQLFRTQIAILQRISLYLCHDTLLRYSTTPAGLAARRHYNALCPSCKLIKYKIEQHSYKLDVNGRVSETKCLVDSESAVFASNLKDLKTIKLALTVIEKIKKFDECLFERKDKSPFDMEKLRAWWFPTKEAQHAAITDICKLAQEIFEKENRLVRVPVPCFIMGDIHGNLKDLITFDKNIWKSAPYISPAHHLFLGDYVDRGPHGVECVIYLLCLKIIAPEKFILLRGNHETREMHKVFSFFLECRDRFNEKIYDIINEVFNRMPFAAVVDDLIFCAHGGIPASASRLEQLRHIPCPMEDVSSKSPPAWEMIWNDVVNQDEYDKIAEMDRIDTRQSRGFIDNKKRNTGYYYSEEAVSKFFEVNGLTHIVRAHEMIDRGFRFNLKGKVITVFSSSKYCGTNNKAASIYVDQEKMRVIRIATNF